MSGFGAPQGRQWRPAGHLRAGGVRQGWRKRACLIASGLGDDTGGGLFVLDRGEFTAIDEVSCTGLALSDNGRRLARLSWRDNDADTLHTPGEVVLYSRKGVLRHDILADLHEPHGALWQGERLVVVSTRTNEIMWLGPDGQIARRWQAPGDGDAWHMNSLTSRHGRLLVSAFGRFSEHREWQQEGVRDGAGVVIDVETGSPVLEGLNAPHNPIWLDHSWYVCNSGSGEVLRIDGSGTLLARRELGGWTRGLVARGDRLYAGVSAHRMGGEELGHARVVALTRPDLREVAQWPLPCREVYDLLFVPERLARALPHDSAAQLLA